MASPLPNKKWWSLNLHHVRWADSDKQEPLEQASQESKNEKALEDWDQKLVSKSVWVMCNVPFRKSNILCHHEAVTDFSEDSLGTQTRVVDSSPTKLQADTVTKATVGSWITHILWYYHFWSLCGFQKRSYCEEHPSEKSIQIGDSKQQDEEVAAEPVFA